MKEINFLYIVSMQNSETAKWNNFKLQVLKGWRNYQLEINIKLCNL